MAQNIKRWALIAALALGLIACACALAFILLCGLTPSVMVYNQSQWPLSHIRVELPAKTLHFENLAPGEEARAFYDANQPKGSYRIKLHRNNLPLATDCGYITSGEWGKRVHIVVNDTRVSCREQLHY
ncbi:hypothetical protein L1F30_11785 [Simiduia sp. 21SJ11W-1]|uniref:hypothetical protein n=1 Tax=Simiduia sp. 21SJ11W-1 TaxID=2909669 RepID=UPI0020A22D01|nr:hypothetical protein [Simiduia sp. 21SJ11W-1]UTA46841.1 hypothetical protein L1F30_11785 [Simiduia sp. 21SJ11W-1]